MQMISEKKGMPQIRALAGLHSKRKLEVFFFDHWHSMFSLCKKIRVQITTNFPNRFQTPWNSRGINSPELLSPPLQGIADFSRQPSASANSSLEKPSSAKEGTHPGNSNLTRIFLLGKFTIATITHTNPYKYPEKLLEWDIFTSFYHVWCFFWFGVSYLSPVLTSFPTARTLLVDLASSVRPFFAILHPRIGPGFV